MGKVISLLLVLVLSACATPTPLSTAHPIPTAVSQPIATSLPTPNGKLIFVDFFAVN